MSRPITTITGASAPIVAYPGTKAMDNVPTAISPSVSIKPARRP